MGDTHVGEAEERREPRTTSCAESGVQHSECHCEHVFFVIGKFPEIGKDVIVERLDHLTDQWHIFNETTAGILDDQTKLEKDVAGLRMEQAQYHETVRMAFHKQQQVIESLLQLMNDMSGRLKGLEDRAERSSLTCGPERPAAPATAELVERLTTLRGAMEEVKPMDRPVESAPYVPPRVDPRVLLFVPMFSESTMLGERAAPTWSMRAEHVFVDLRNLTRETSAAARGPPTSTAHAVYAEEEIHNMEARAKEAADGNGHGKGHPSGNLLVERPRYRDLDSRRFRFIQDSNSLGTGRDWTSTHGGKRRWRGILQFRRKWRYTSWRSRGVGRGRRREDRRPQGYQSPLL